MTSIVIPLATGYAAKLDDLRDYMTVFIDGLVKRSMPYYRIIDKSIAFPQNYQWIKHDSLMEVSRNRWNDTNGWNKPDASRHGLEIMYLWKDTPILTFEQYLNDKCGNPAGNR